MLWGTVFWKVALITSENQVFLKYFILHSQNYWSLLKTVIIFLGIIFSSLIYLQSIESAVTWAGQVSADMEDKWTNKKTCKTLRKELEQNLSAWLREVVKERYVLLHRISTKYSCFYVYCLTSTLSSSVSSDTK